MKRKPARPVMEAFEEAYLDGANVKDAHQVAESKAHELGVWCPSYQTLSRYTRAADMVWRRALRVRRRELSARLERLDEVIRARAEVARELEELERQEQLVGMGQLSLELAGEVAA
jgi:hypothetical protein